MLHIGLRPHPSGLLIISDLQHSPEMHLESSFTNHVYELLIILLTWFFFNATNCVCVLFMYQCIEYVLYKFMYINENDVF